VDYRDYFSEEELARFLPAFLQDGMVNDRLVTLPVAKSTELMFINQTAYDRFTADTGIGVEGLATWDKLFETSVAYYDWTDAQTPDIPDDGKTLFVHDFHFNFFQTGTGSLGEPYFENEKLAFGPTFKNIWDDYAKACIAGGVWLHDGYATEPLRTGESIVSVASSASVLYFSEEVIYADNNSENIRITVHPIPRFENGESLVMQRGAGMCTVKSTPEREKAAVTFLKWLTAPENNTRFAVETGYMPVTQEAFEDYLPQEIENLTEQKYVELYKAYQQTQESYKFYSAPHLDTYLDTETSFEETIRRCMRSGRESWLGAEERDDGLLDKISKENYDLLKELMSR
jgi:multiple sugar transport system substrate-binding protein